MSDQHVDADRLRITRHAVESLAAHAGIVLDQDGYTVTPPDGATLTEAVAHLLYARHTRARFGTWDELTDPARARWADIATTLLGAPDAPSVDQLAERVYNGIGDHPLTSPWATLARGERARFTITAQHVARLIAEADPAPAARDTLTVPDPTSPKPPTEPDLNDLRTALTKLANGFGATPAQLRALLAAHPAPETIHFSAYGSSMTSCGRIVSRVEQDFTDRRALTTCAACRVRFTPAPVSDARREDVARAIMPHQPHVFSCTCGWKMTGVTAGECARQWRAHQADAVLAVLPAKPVVGDVVEAACAWSDYRKDYGASSDERVRDLEHKAFMAGRQSALGTLDAGGAQR